MCLGFPWLADQVRVLPRVAGGQVRSLGPKLYSTFLPGLFFLMRWVRFPGVFPPYTHRKISVSGVLTEEVVLNDGAGRWGWRGRRTGTRVCGTSHTTTRATSLATDPA